LYVLGGKTTLLNALSRRQGITSGKVTLNGGRLPSYDPFTLLPFFVDLTGWLTFLCLCFCPDSPRCNFNKISAYVMQDDRLFEVLTPRELFEFSANLRLPREMTAAQRKARIDKVITQLRLQACADTRVGGALMRGLSGGERKRTSIGYELITNPALLFLDEPTSGLDSFTSLALILNLKELAHYGHTVICTIHQPSAEIFRNFDKLNLLVQGRTAFFGRAADSIDFFSGLGYPCPTYTNPTDFFMELLQTVTDEDKVRAGKIVDAAVKKMEDDPIKLMEAPAGEGNGAAVKTFKRAPRMVQIAELTKRGWQVITRNPITFQARIAQNLCIAILVGLVYLRLDTTQSSIADREGALFFICMGQVMTSLMGVVLTFPLERSLLVREQSNGMYSIFNYFMGKFFSSLPMDIFFPSFFSVVVYWMVGFNPNGAAPFFMFLLSNFALVMCSASMGLLLGCLLPSAEIAVSIAPIALIPFMLFGGFFAKLSSVPDWLSWIQYISVFKWGFQALSTTEFNGMTFMCAPSEYVSVTTPEGVVKVCPITDGSQVLDNLGYTYSRDYWIAIGITLGLFIFFRILALISLIWQTNRALKKTQT